MKTAYPFRLFIGIAAAFCLLVLPLLAQNKRFITLERSAHVPMLEEPGLFLLTLIQEVLPLTEGRAAFAPPR